jgi:predicted RNA-binding Zn-ribbon protein involved in translation (DUF1610 family)
MKLKTMNPQVLLKLLEGYTDTITPLAEKREQFYKDQNCPQCQGNAFTRCADSRTLFNPDDPLPRFLLKCQNCDCLLDPFTGLILSLGNLGKAYVPTIPILNSKP